MGDWEWTLTIETGQKGGPGSGHHGHAGRPGQRGGSAPGNITGRPSVKFTPAETVEEAYRLAEQYGLKVGGRNAEEITDIMWQAMEAADYADPKRKQEFYDHWIPIMRDAIAPPEFQRETINGVLEQIHRGATESSPLVIHGPREGYNDKWSTGQHDPETGLTHIFYQARESPHIQELITNRLSHADAIYSNPTGGIWVHEYGHRYAETTKPEVLRRAQVYAQQVDEDKPFRQWVKKSISYYAATNARELAAECYTLRQHPDFGQLPKDAQQFIKEVLGF